MSHTQGEALNALNGGDSVTDAGNQVNKRADQLPVLPNSGSLEGVLQNGDKNSDLKEIKAPQEITSRKQEDPNGMSVISNRKGEDQSSNDAHEEAPKTKDKKWTNAKATNLYVSPEPSQKPLPKHNIAVENNNLSRYPDIETEVRLSELSKQPKAGTDDDYDSGTTSNTFCSTDGTSAQAGEESDDDVGNDLVTQNFKKAQNDNQKEIEEGCSELQLENSSDSGDFTSRGLKWYNPVRHFCGRIVNDERFQIFIIVLIIFNALLMGVGTYNFVEDNPRIQKAFDMADLGFLGIFTIESALQIGYHGYQLFYDGWLVFDLLVVLMSWTLDSVQIFRAIRVFRAFRLVARLGVLKDLVNAIVAVLPRIGSIMLLFCLVLYIYSVLCTVLFGDSNYGEENTDYFGRLDYSLFTLFQFVTLDGWGDITRQVMDVYPWAVYIILSFLMISAFILYSLVVAVVCDAVAVVEHPDIALKKFEEKMKKEQTKTKRRVRALKRHLDDLSQQQMETLLSVQTSLLKYEKFRQDAKASENEAPA